MELPWKWYFNRCVRSVVRTIALKTGNDRQQTTPFTGRKHKALDDCSHQIDYLVKAWNDLDDVNVDSSSNVSDAESEVITSKRPIQINAENVAQTFRVPPGYVGYVPARPLLTPDSLISSETLVSKDAAVPVFVAPRFLSTPGGRFTETNSSQDTGVEGPPSKKVRLSHGVEPPAHKDQA
jgi:hypothetical protein